MRRVLLAAVVIVGAGLLASGEAPAQPNPYADIAMDDRGQMDCARVQSICTANSERSQRALELCDEHASQCVRDNRTRWDSTWAAHEEQERQHRQALLLDIQRRRDQVRDQVRRGTYRRGGDAELDEAGRAAEEEAAPAAEADMGDGQATSDEAGPVEGSSDQEEAREEDPEAR